MATHRLEPTGSGWQARLVESPKTWERGDNEAAAVEALVVTIAPRVEVDEGWDP